jgi:hypothetical protein
LDFEASDFRLLEPGETLFKLAAKAKCKELTDSLADAADSDAPQETRMLVNPEEVKQSLVKLSVTYQVLTSETAFLGVVRQQDKATGELIKAVIPTSISAQAIP